MQVRKTLGSHTTIVTSSPCRSIVSLPGLPHVFALCRAARIVKYVVWNVPYTTALPLPLERPREAIDGVE